MPGPLVAPLVTAGIGAAGAIGGNLLQRNAAGRQERALGRVAADREQFQNVINQMRSDNTQQSIGQLGGFIDQRNANNLSQLGAVTRGAPTGQGVQQIQQMGQGLPAGPAALAANSPDQLRVAQAAQAQYQPMIDAQNQVVGTQIDRNRETSAMLPAQQQARLAQLGLGRDLGRFQEDRGRQSAELSLTDFLHRLRTNERFDNASQVGQTQAAAGGLLSQLGGGLLGSGIGGLF